MWKKYIVSDPIYNSYFSPVDDLIGSPLIGSKTELAANRAISQGPNSLSNSKEASFQDILKKYSQSTSQSTASGVNSDSQKHKMAGCHPLTPINCDPTKSISQSRQNIQNEIETIINNITNADKPGYKRVLPFKDENGNPIYDETAGKLEKTDWHLDFAITGPGKGFQLETGEFTRDGRFKFDTKGRVVTVGKEIPVKICYKDGAPMDWSLKQLTVDTEGNVKDKHNGKQLGRIEADFAPQSKIVQHYVERSNVNTPVELMSISQKFRILELTNNLFSTGTRLNNEAVQILRNL